MPKESQKKRELSGHNQHLICTDTELSKTVDMKAEIGIIAYVVADAVRLLQSGRIAQRESTCLTRRGS